MKQKDNNTIHITVPHGKDDSKTVIIRSHENVQIDFKLKYVFRSLDLTAEAPYTVALVGTAPDSDAEYFRLLTVKKHIASWQQSPEDRKNYGTWRFRLILVGEGGTYQTDEIIMQSIPTRQLKQLREDLNE